jgi:hypothetical protein
MFLNNSHEISNTSIPNYGNRVFHQSKALPFSWNIPIYTLDIRGVIPQRKTHCHVFQPGFTTCPSVEPQNSGNLTFSISLCTWLLVGFCDPSTCIETPPSSFPIYSLVHLTSFGINTSWLSPLQQVHVLVLEHVPLPLVKSAEV